MKRASKPLVKPLSPKQLKKRCNEKNFKFETTQDIRQPVDIINQDRALSALKFGIEMQKPGYNIFALGAHGIDKHSAIKNILLKTRVKSDVPIYDWCYVHNFDSPRYPVLIQLPHNTGRKLGNEMAKLVKFLQIKIPEIFEGRALKGAVKKIQLRHERKKNKIANDLYRQAKKDNISINVIQNEYTILPMINNTIIPEDEFEKLPVSEQKQYESQIEKYLEKVENLVDLISEIDEQVSRLIKQLSEEFVKNLVKAELHAIAKNYKKHLPLQTYFSDVENDIIANVKDFLPEKDSDKSIISSSEADMYTKFSRYQVNVFVHCTNKKCPVVYESNPTYLNLLGRIEQISEEGLLVTNHMFIRSGALHRANSGYLLLDAHRVLTHTQAWEGLKHALYRQKVEIKPLEQDLGLSSSVSIEPDAMPLDIKIILFGDNSTYEALYYADPDFKKLFKVVAEFDEELERTYLTEKKYIQLIATIVKQEGLLPFSKNAVASVIDFAAKITGDATRLSVHNWAIKDLLIEANYWAQKEKKHYVGIVDVQKAKETKINRSNHLIEDFKKQIKEGQILINTSGSMVGQVNALTVIQEGNFSFGQPMKITCTTRIGDSGVIDIEREVELGGPIHTKGVLILTGYLSGKYAKNHVLSLSASIVMEQNYSSIDGDSASLAELCSLLSSIANLPIKQTFAVTGSVNQFGEVQAIGGVNEKIEGFFDVCQSRGFKKDQGVIIPKSNVKHLMLKEATIQAVKDNKFNVYAVSHVDEAIALLTGKESGRADKKGAYPKDSVNYLVETSLIENAKLAKDDKS